MNSNLISQKSALRKLMKTILKQITPDEKQRQTTIIQNYLLNQCEKFQNSKHIALYLAMKHEEIDTIPLIEHLLKTESKNKHIYVPYVDMSTKDHSEMVFYELKSIAQFKTEMNEDNKYNIRQFNNVSSLTKADESLFDLVIVPGLAFSSINQSIKLKPITRLGRGKGYYDVFLSKIPECYTIAVGFNQQYLPLNENQIELPVDATRDICLNEFICESLIN